MPSTASPLFRIDDHRLLCYGDLPHKLSGKETIAIDGNPVKRPYLAAHISDVAAGAAPQIATILTVDQPATLDTAQQVSFAAPHYTANWNLPPLTSDNYEQIRRFINDIDAIARNKLFFLHMMLAKLSPPLTKNERFLQLCSLCRAELTPTASIHYASRLNDASLAVICTLPTAPTYTNATLLLSGAKQLRAQSTELTPLPFGSVSTPADHTAYLLVATFDSNQLQDINGLEATLLLKDQVVPLPSLPLAPTDDTNHLLGYLQQQPESLRLTLRDAIVQALMAQTPTHARTEAQALITTLQYYLLPSHQTLCDPAAPVGFNIESAVPLGDKGVFLSGWLYDPQQLVGQIQLFSDQGTALGLTPPSEQFSRPDVAELYEDANFPAANDRFGFALLIPYPDSILKNLQDWPHPQHFRAKLTLKSGLHYTVAPKPTQLQSEQATQQLLDRVAPWAPATSHSFRALGRALRLVQEQKTNTVQAVATTTFGAPLSEPAISIIIPLASSAYLQTQLARFNADHFILEKVEIIYALTNPNQRTEVEQALQAYAALYPLSIKLLTPSTTTTTLHATNLAASQASASMLAFMQESTIPHQAGWLEPLIQVIDSQIDAGAVIPQLRHEDESVCHTGGALYPDPTLKITALERAYAGYPTQAEVVSGNRRTIPTLAAGCILLSADVFSQAQQFNTSYLTEDYSYAELGMTISKHGKNLYYLPESSLYQLGIASDNNTVCAQLDAWHFQSRWQSQMERIAQMDKGAA